MKGSLGKKKLARDSNFPNKTFDYSNGVFDCSIRVYCIAFLKLFLKVIA